MSNLKLSFVLEAFDKATGPMKKVFDSIERVNAPATQVTSTMKNLSYQFGQVAGIQIKGQWGTMAERGQRLSQSAQGIAQTFGAITVAAGGAFYAMKRTIDQVDRTNDVAKKLGMSVEQYQKMGYAAELNGASQEEMGQALQFLSQNMVEATNGSQEAAEWFRRVGIPLNQLKTMNAGEAFEAIADKFKSVADTGPNAAKKIAAMKALLGRSGTELKQTLDLGSDGLRGFYKEAVRVGAVVDGPTADAFSNFNDNFDKMKKSIFGVMTEIIKVALPSLDALVNKLTEGNIAGKAEWGQKIGAAIGNLVSSLPVFLNQLGKVFATLAMLAGAANVVAQAMGGWENVILVVAGLMGAKLVLGVFGVITAFAALAKTIALVSWATALTPLGWFLGAVALIAVAVYAIYRNWEPIKGFFSGIWGAIKPAAMLAWNFLRFLFAWSPLGLLANNWGAITGWMGVLWDAVAGIVASAWGVLKDVVVSGLALIGGLLLQWAPVRLVMAAWDPVITFLKEVWKTIADIVGPILNAVGGAAKAVGGMAMDKFGGNIEQNYGLRIDGPQGQNLAAPESGATGTWAASALPTGSAAKAEVGGTLKIQIDQEGRARVAEAKSNNKSVDFDVYSGMTMVGS